MLPLVADGAAAAGRVPPPPPPGDGDAAGDGATVRPATNCKMPGGLGAQFGLPWLGCGRLSCDSEEALDSMVGGGGGGGVAEPDVGNRLERFAWYLLPPLIGEWALEMRSIRTIVNEWF